MATMITSECINCGACEPECPNTAIYQGGVEWELNGVKHPALAADTFYIVPEKCTECVGFFDHEACAAVCPVDCCLPNPDIVESEDLLITRARQLHPDKEFGPDVPSRFKKAGAAAPAPAPAAEAAQPAAAAPAPSPAPAAAQPAPAPAAAKPAPAPAAPAPAPPRAAATPVASLAIPDIEDWEVPVECYRCKGSYAVAFRHFRSGVVLYCPFCNGSTVVNSLMHQHVAEALQRFHAAWRYDFEAFQEQRQRDLDAFEERQRRALENFNETLKRLGQEARPPGAPRRRAWIFG